MFMSVIREALNPAQELKPGRALRNCRHLHAHRQSNVRNRTDAMQSRPIQRSRTAEAGDSMHTPTPGSDPRPEQDDDDVRTPPVPPDQEGDVVPIEEPPKPGRSDSPMIAARRTP